MIVLEPNKNPESILEQAKKDSNPTKGQPGRPPRTREKKIMKRKLRQGEVEQIDKPWLLSQLLDVFDEKGIRPSDKLRALELMAKLSGYDGRDSGSETDYEAIQELIDAMDEDK